MGRVAIKKLHVATIVTPPRTVIYISVFPKSKLLHGCAEFAEEMEWSRGESNSRAETVNNTRLRK
jgi:hypothetical protein